MQSTWWLMILDIDKSLKQVLELLNNNVISLGTSSTSHWLVNNFSAIGESKRSRISSVQAGNLPLGEYKEI